MAPTSPIPNQPGAPHSDLELQLIRAFLRERGYTRQELRKLPEAKARQIMGQACRYASLKLAEIESRVQFKQKIRYE